MSILKAENVAGFLRTVDGSGYFGHGSENLFAAFSRLYPEQANLGVGYFNFTMNLLDIEDSELRKYYKNGYEEDVEEDEDYETCDDPECDQCNPLDDYEEDSHIEIPSKKDYGAATKEVFDGLKTGNEGTRFYFHIVQSDEFEAKLAKLGYRVIAKRMLNHKEYKSYNKFIIAQETEPFFLTVYHSDTTSSVCSGFCCGTKPTLEKFNDLTKVIEVIREHVKPVKYEITVKKGASCFMIGVNDMGKLQLFQLNKVVCDLSKDLIQKSYPNVNEEKISEFFTNPNPKGKLLLFHGIPGSGKTTYIRHLLSNVYRGKVVFVNAEIFSKLTSASFIPFAIQNLQRSLLLIEDAEQLLVSRGQDHTDRNSSVADLLNYTDGLLGDALNLKVLATFNTSVQEIDSALLRKGRLNHREEFSYLDKEQAEALYKHLTGEDKELEHKNYSLADIYGLIPDE